MIFFTRPLTLVVWLFQTGTLRRPSTPFPVTVLRAPLQAVPPRAAPGPGGVPALSGADLPVVTMPVVPMKNGRGAPVELPVVAPAVTCGSSVHGSVPAVAMVVASPVM